MSHDISQHDLDTIERSAQRLGREFFNQLTISRLTILERRWWDEQILDMAMRDEAVKIQMFRFVDVLPMLHTEDAIADHLREYFRDLHDRLPAPVRWGLALVNPGTLTGRAVAKAARAGAMRQARRFIAATTLSEVGQAIRQQRRLGRAFTLDILGEVITSDNEAEAYFHAYLELIRGVDPVVSSWSEVPQIDCDAQGALPRSNISVKLSALDSQADEIDPDGTASRIAPRLRALLRAARGDNRSAASRCLESVARPAVPIICSNSSCPGPLQKIRSDVALLRRRHKY